MDQELKRKYMALAILANSGNLKRAQLCTALRKITPFDHLLFVLDRITAPVALRRGMNIFTHHKDFTLRALFAILPEGHYQDYQDILGDALLRHHDFNEKHLCTFLELAGFEAGAQAIDQLAQDQKNQSFLTNVFQEYEYPDDCSKNISEAIVRHPLTAEELSDLTAKTDHMGAKLVFAKAAVGIKDLDADVVRGFFRQIEGYAQQEVEFVDAIHLSAGETFFVLLTETEFEPTRKACVRKLKCCTHSIATIEYWRENAERHIRLEAIKWFDALLTERYTALPTPQLLDILVDLRDGEQARRDKVLGALSLNIHQLREIAGIE